MTQRIETAIFNDLKAMLADLQRSGDIPTQSFVEDIGANSRLEALALDSVAKVILQAAIEERFEVPLTEDDVRDQSTISELVAIIALRIVDRSVT